MNIDFTKFPSPCYVVDERLIRRNLEILDSVKKAAGCRILLALKGFSMYSVFLLIGQYLNGIAASSLNEARLGCEEMGREVHTYSPSFIETEFNEIMQYSDHIVFNSFDQWNRYKNRAAGKTNNKGNEIKYGIRVNPEYSEVSTPIYNPCYTNSRLGVTLANFIPDELDGITGLHFHTLCEQNSDVLERTIPVIDEKFGRHIAKMKWLNMGGGHHITRADYDISGLIRSIMFFKEKYGVEVYLEPGEAIALNTGFLVCTVLDIVHNGMDIAILDASAACHMPDVIEMPYRPDIINAGKPGEYEFTYRLAGNTCLAGDIIGDYSFRNRLSPGDRLVFTDMAHYTMVKNNTFNGVALPSIGVYREKEGETLLKKFDYQDYKSRL